MQTSAEQPPTCCSHSGRVHVRPDRPRQPFIAQHTAAFFKNEFIIYFILYWLINSFTNTLLCATVSCDGLNAALEAFPSWGESLILPSCTFWQDCCRMWIHVNGKYFTLASVSASKSPYCFNPNPLSVMSPKTFRVIWSSDAEWAQQMSDNTR